MGGATARALLLWIERSLLVAGAILLALYGAARVDGWVSSRSAVQSFDVDRSSSPEPRRARPESDPRATGADPQPNQQVDFSLRSEERIRAFRKSLSLTEDRALAVLELEQLRLRVPVFEGTDDLVLNRGAGWIQGTARPGVEGNTGIAAHRDGFFRGLGNVMVGDPVRLLVRDRTLVYRVEGIEIVDPEDVHVLLPREMPSLTLVTCWPFYYIGNAPHRYVVHATLERGTE